ncbi:hypothetical protein CYLTODRAFT_427188 [Cylindrobasidium torrendii FP15055 ss-10]|uniref:Uncharacterized protein n=1 Tax=Cylindrobasidium torrendii FP15055 ss-10 TaxID=1314674 RepID=A0A0D7AVM8_9AGAR|nr:hypothetical protein CYLTODRAFT_427188 [Cylindrobasidium torrendii FP15055 ss-10]
MSLTLADLTRKTSSLIPTRLDQVTRAQVTIAVLASLGIVTVLTTTTRRRRRRNTRASNSTSPNTDEAPTGIITTLGSYWRTIVPGSKEDPKPSTPPKSTAPPKTTGLPKTSASPVSPTSPKPAVKPKTAPRPSAAAPPTPPPAPKRSIERADTESFDSAHSRESDDSSHKSGKTKGSDVFRGVKRLFSDDRKRKKEKSKDKEGFPATAGH